MQNELREPSEIQEAIVIILNAKLKDEAYIIPRLNAALDVMKVMPHYEHLTILKAIFHIPIKEEVEDFGA